MRKITKMLRYIFENWKIGKKNSISVWKNRKSDTIITITIIGNLFQMMFGVNFFSAILCAVSLIEQGTLWSSIKFGAEHVDFSRDVFLLSLSGAIGQIFIYSTIERFGPIVFAVIMTIRQVSITHYIANFAA